ncbi:MAG: DNA mismatch repair protein MutS [Nitrospiria bacterium]
MNQYLEIKKGYPEAILFFRVGDFYEMFLDDAVTASKTLQITLTSRDKNSTNPIPLCGVPYHAASGYIAKLIRSGFSVAICDQVEDPAAAKGLVKREVVRVITPGTVIEPELLSEKENNYVASLMWDSKSPLSRKTRIGLAYLDLSTGDFRMLPSCAGWGEIEGELLKIGPKEILIPSSKKRKVVMEKEGAGKETLSGLLQKSWTIRQISPEFFNTAEADEILKKHFQVHSVQSLGGDPLSLCAAGALLSHIKETQKTALGNIVSLRPIVSEDLMRIHPLAIRHLDLVPLSRDKTSGTLAHLLDQTMTAMGGRLLKDWILHPLLRPEKINQRLDAIDYFFEDLALRTALRKQLKKIADIERLIGRISLKAAHPRDLIALKESTRRLPEIQKELTHPGEFSAQKELPRHIAEMIISWDNLDEIFKLIDKTIVPEPPLSLKEGGIIKEGYSEELDALRLFQKEGRSMLTEVENRERRRTGIETLKVRYNRVFGYYIEVSKAQLSKVPMDYVRKQTLTHAERFITEALKEIEEKLSGATEKIKSMESEAFECVRLKLSRQVARIQEMGRKLALLDLLTNLSEVAHQNNYCRPEVDGSQTIRIIEGRHPVLEQGDLLNNPGDRQPFIPNDTLIAPPSQRMLILTGPNMAGKSTYMRQIALIILMAQMGSFVPAKEAAIGVADQIFTRVGAQDAIIEGMSTFMVEMTEMAQILLYATDKSLILLDEIGRGTSTYDGISIAWAIAEYVHSDQLGARTLFATHYHELTGLADQHEGIRNYHILVREWNDEILFLRKMVPGGADKSYGIQVGRLAGLPPKIVRRAKEVLKELEEKSWDTPIHVHPSKNPNEKKGEQPDLFSAVAESEKKPITHPVVEALRKIDPLNMTPIKAIQILADLSRKAKNE